MNHTDPRFDRIPSPALLYFPDIIRENIRQALKLSGGPSRLRPHIKTHKSGRVIALMREQGIDKVKCATPAEAETAAREGVPDVLIAYQLTEVQMPDLTALIRAFPGTAFSVLIDNRASLEILRRRPAEPGETVGVFLDLNIGQNRCGAGPDQLQALLPAIGGSLIFRGLHAYDGHIHNPPLAERQCEAEKCIGLIRDTLALFESAGCTCPEVVTGGSPAFGIYAETTPWQLSPGTFALWDLGYGRAYPELPFRPAACLLGRVISTPVSGQITVDTGCKALSCDGAGDPGYVVSPEGTFCHISQSEEHWVVKTDTALPVGTPLCIVPHHICSTVALYDRARALYDGRDTPESWEITRQRELKLNKTKDIL